MVFRHFFTSTGRLSRVILAVAICCLVAPAGQLIAQETRPENLRETTPRPPDSVAAGPDFRVERVPVAGGSEIITIFSTEHLEEGHSGPPSELPLLSVLRDTLGDDIRENDRLRYVWVHSYTRPTFTQKLSSVVPFLYTRTTNRSRVGSAPPPPVAELNGSGGGLWDKMFWMAFRRIVIADSMGLRTTVGQYRQNTSEYRKGAIAGAMTLLSLYEAAEGERLLTRTERQDIQARLSLRYSSTFGSLQTENLSRFYESRLSSSRGTRGQNWDLLRQAAEEQGLYFEPLTMSDGYARHAIVWTSASDVAANHGRKFNGRFLNIKNPWSDPRLSQWKGFSEERWFDGENRIVEPNTPGARAERMIPLAVYGLDHPKIPILLIDFRNNANPKKREMSRRVLNDMTGNVLAISKFSSLPYFVGRFVYERVTSRRGMDINQSSRVRAYSQLKLLISLSESLDPELKDEMSSRIEHATLNPLQNDAGSEARIAREQYKNLMAYAARPDGLPARVERDRRQEMVPLKHGRGARTLFNVARVVTFGAYTHREKATPELLAKMDQGRQLAYHERVVREVAQVSRGPEVDSDLSQLKASMAFIAERGSAAGGKTARGIAKIFGMTRDDEVRSLCLAALYKINNNRAKHELLAILRNENVDVRWRDLSAGYLTRARDEGQRMSGRDAAAISGALAN